MASRPRKQSVRDKKECRIRRDFGVFAGGGRRYLYPRRKPRHFTACSQRSQAATPAVGGTRLKLSLFITRTFLGVCLELPTTPHHSFCTLFFGAFAAPIRTSQLSNDENRRELATAPNTPDITPPYFQDQHSTAEPLFDCLQEKSDRAQRSEGVARRPQNSVESPSTRPRIPRQGLPRAWHDATWPRNPASTSK